MCLAYSSTWDSMSYRRCIIATIFARQQPTKRLTTRFSETIINANLLGRQVDETGRQQVAPLSFQGPTIAYPGRIARTTPPHWWPKDVRNIENASILAKSATRLSKLCWVMFWMLAYKRESAWFMAGAASATPTRTKVWMVTWPYCKFGHFRTQGSPPFSHMLF